MRRPVLGNCFIRSQGLQMPNPATGESPDWSAQTTPPPLGAIFATSALLQRETRRDAARSAPAGALRAIGADELASNLSAMHYLEADEMGPLLADWMDAAEATSQLLASCGGASLRAPNA
jgi:hypothetical protein